MGFFRNFLKGASLTTALFVFQACYGTPKWLHDEDMSFRVVSAVDDTKLVELAIRKDLLAKYSGAVEYGALSVCPDELPDDIKAAQEAIGALPGEITLEGKVFNETVIENWYQRTIKIRLQKAE